MLARVLPVLTVFSFLFPGCVRDDYYRNYLEEQSGFTIPGNTSNIRHFTRSDLAFTSHYSIPPESVNIFAGEAGLSPEPPCRWDPILFAGELPPPWNSIPEQGSFLYGAGSSGWNSWDILLNTETGDMWVTVHYTDASGDSPE